MNAPVDFYKVVGSDRTSLTHVLKRPLSHPEYEVLSDVLTVYREKGIVAPDEEILRLLREDGRVPNPELLLSVHYAKDTFVHPHAFNPNAGQDNGPGIYGFLYSEDAVRFRLRRRRPRDCMVIKLRTDREPFVELWQCLTPQCRAGRAFVLT